MLSQSELKQKMAQVPNFPVEGILFYDISPLLSDHKAFESCLDYMSQAVEALPIQPTHFMGAESRGFIFASALAARLSCGLVLARKPGKLPSAVHSASYALEYGQATLQVEKNILGPNDRVVVIDDLLATGGTAQACGQLVEASNSQIAGYVFLLELCGLNGRDQLADAPVNTVLSMP